VGLQVDGKDVPGLGLSDCIALRTNGTDKQMRYRNGKTLAALRGQNVSLRFNMSSALLYTVGFV